MKVGDLVKTTYPNGYTAVGIILRVDVDLVKCCFGWVGKDYLEVIA